MKKYKEYPQHQMQILPPSADDLIDSNHIVRVVDKFVSTLSSTIWDHAFPGGGAPSYHPKMMLKIILYGYCSRIYSCREIARAVRQDVTFMWIAGMQRPNFNTINRFRSDYFRDSLEKVFTELLDFLHQKGYISFTDYFVDGTKLEANAGRNTYVWKKSTQRYKASVQKRVKQLLNDIDKINAAEDEKYGDADLPERGEAADITSQEIHDVAQKLSDKMAEESSKKKHRALQSRIKKLTKDADQLARYEQQEQILEDRNSYSKTDHDATFMRLKDDRLRAAYNSQISTENQFITNYSVSQNASDSTTFVHHLKKIVNRGQKYLPVNYNSDCAYGSEENYTLLRKHNITNYLKFNNFHIEDKLKEKFPYHYDNFIYSESDDSFQCPEGKQLSYQETIERETKTAYKLKLRVYECDDCSSCGCKGECTTAVGNRCLYYNPTFKKFRDQARDNLNSEYGISLRKRRGNEVETPFGDLKHNRLVNRFYLRGLPKVEHEFGLHCIAHNLRKASLKQMKKAA